MGNGVARGLKGMGFDLLKEKGEMGVGLTWVIKWVGVCTWVNEVRYTWDKGVV